MSLSNVSIVYTAAAGPLWPPFFNAPIIINAGPGLPTAGVQPASIGNLSLTQLRVRYSANQSRNPSTPWPFLMAVASKELRGVNGDVVVESTTPHIVCA